MSAMIKRTRMTPRGYTRPAYVCFDCDRVTSSVMSVRRGNIFTLVCRTGTGCQRKGAA